MLVPLVQAAYRGEGGWTTEAHLIDGTRTDADELTSLLPCLLVATDQGRVVGCCALDLHDGVGHFGTFAVDPALQGKGVGALLLAAAEDRARDLGLDQVEMSVVSVRDELVAWYERRGYSRTGEIRPFPYGVERNGRPRRDDLEFAVLRKEL